MIDTLHNIGLVGLVFVLMQMVYRMKARDRGTAETCITVCLVIIFLLLLTL